MSPKQLKHITVKIANFVQDNKQLTQSSMQIAHFIQHNNILS